MGKSAQHAINVLGHIRRIGGLLADSLGFRLNYLPGPEERTRHIQVATVIGIAVVFPFALLNIYAYNMAPLGQAELFAVFFLLAPAAAVGQYPALVGLAETLIVLATLVILVALMLFGGVEGTGIFWIYTAPFLFFFLKDQRQGWWHSLLFIGVAALYLRIIAPRLSFAYPHSPVVALHLLFSLGFYTLVAAAFNKMRSSFEQQLQQRVDEKTADAKALLEELQYLATHDSLTGLPNRTTLRDVLDQEIEQARSTGQGLMVCYLRIERLFELTNILGTESGDNLVRQIADHLRRITGADGALARTNRDEFVIVHRLACPTADPGVLGQLIADQQFSTREQGYSLYLEFTQGVAVFPDHSDNANALLNKAEQALLLARKSGQQWLVYDVKQEETFVSHHLLFGRLREALFNHHLQVYFQPQVSLKTRRVIGAEALARWFDPVNGPIPPYQFIPVAEESGLIRPLTRWLIGECLRECARWHRSGLDLDISLNLSAMNLLDPGLRSDLQQAQAETGVPPARVNLEITESCFMASPERAMDMIHALHGDGFRLSIDDYGTGFASLSYLKNLPISELKIDQSFVRKLLENPGDQAIIASTIDLAHNFRLSVVAEGVEDEVTARWLLSRGCDIGQGYCFAKPMPMDEFITLALERGTGHTPQEQHHEDHSHQ